MQEKFTLFLFSIIFIVFSSICWSIKYLEESRPAFIFSNFSESLEKIYNPYENETLSERLKKLGKVSRVSRVFPFVENMF